MLMQIKSRYDKKINFKKLPCVLKKFSIFYLGCEVESRYIGDGYCDDQANNEACHFDKGDCCGLETEKKNKYCDECLCKEGKNGPITQLWSNIEICYI